MATYSAQPDATAGIDARIAEAVPNNNFGVGTALRIGRNTTNSNNRGLIKFDLSGIDPAATVSSSKIELYMSAETLSRTSTFSLYRVKRDWGEGTRNNATATSGECSWNDAKQGSVAWSTAGCGNTTNDREAVALGAVTLTSTEAAGWKTFTLDAAKVQEWISGATANYGVLLTNDTADANSTYNDYVDFTPSDGTAANRPKIEVIYTTSHAQTSPVYTQKTTWFF